MQKEIKVSVIIRAYNAEGTIERAVESVLMQDFPRDSFEIVVVDDGSTDATVERLGAYKSLAGFRLIRQSNKGAVPAANSGLREARGKYVVLLDSDDVLGPELLKEEVMCLEYNPDTDFVYSDYFEKKGEAVIIVSTENIFHTIAIGIMFRRKKFEAIGFYDEALKFAEYDLLLRTWEAWHGMRIAKPLFTYIRREKSITGNSRWVDEAFEELRKLHPNHLKEIKTIRTY